MTTLHYNENMAKKQRKVNAGCADCVQDTETTTDELPIDMTLAVRVFDTDHKGYIESADLRFIILNMDYSIPRDELNELIKSSNLDQDKKISYQEFLALLMPMREK